jgi:deoxyribodipyrimidine photolyase-related protein
VEKKRGRGETPVRNLILVLGDQLDRGSMAFDDLDPRSDVVWMAEAVEEIEHVWATKAHIVIFLSAMRHFCEELRDEGLRVCYRRLDEATDPDVASQGSLAGELARAIERLHPEGLIVVQPGEWRVEQMLRSAAVDAGLSLDIRPDRHFLCSRQTFAEHVKGRKQLRMERFYRQMRKENGVLMEAGEPAGGRWNYDAENRERFGREGPGEVPVPRSFAPDEITRQVVALVEERFAGHPGSLGHFDWAVTAAQARLALEDFCQHRLACFGDYQDAMWSDQPYLYHSRLASAMNLKLLDPRGVLQAASEAHDRGDAPLNAVEGFVRQILGWREYVRGIYWHYMPDYLQRNALNASLPLPDLYWTAETEMRCLRQCVQQTLDYGYAHHIQRLMVTGLFALLLGVDPVQVHEWYLAVYVDAVEWVELPNTLGMSQFADGGLMASKPYCASGKYIQRMSNYCRDCRYDPGQRLGETACPFTTLYWDFLFRKQDALSENYRMGLQLRNLERITDERRAICRQAQSVRKQVLGRA